MHQIQDLATITTTNDLEGLKGSDVSAHTVYTAKESVQTTLKNYLLPLDEDKLQTLIIKMRHGFRFGVRLNTMSQTFQLVFTGGDPHTPLKAERSPEIIDSSGKSIAVSRDTRLPHSSTATSIDKSTQTDGKSRNKRERGDSRSRSRSMSSSP